MERSISAVFGLPWQNGASRLDLNICVSRYWCVGMVDWTYLRIILNQRVRSRQELTQNLHSSITRMQSL